jgi:hypothetical protein
MLKLTLDTNCIDLHELRARAAEVGAELAAFSVSRNETKGSPFAVHLRTIPVIPEQSVWKDGAWADGVWADRSWRSARDVTYTREDGSESLGDPFEDVLSVISNCSFPPPEDRTHLSDGQRRQFRDAMILSLHAQHRRDVFVSGDKRAFISAGRRELLERMLGTRICTPAEAVALLAQLPKRCGAESSNE